MLGLETVYSHHHKSRGEGFAILQEERGNFLKNGHNDFFVNNGACVFRYQQYSSCRKIKQL